MLGGSPVEDANTWLHLKKLRYSSTFMLGGGGALWRMPTTGVKVYCIILVGWELFRDLKYSKVLCNTGFFWKLIFLGIKERKATIRRRKKNFPYPLLEFFLV